MEKDKNIFKGSIDQPSKDFTKNLMMAIESEELALSKIIKKSAVETPSINFTSQVMSAIKPNASRAYTPVISQKNWLFIGLGLVMLCAYIIAFGNQNIQFTTTPPINNVLSIWNSILELISNSLVFATVMALSLVVLIDQKQYLKKIFG